MAGIIKKQILKHLSRSVQGLLVRGCLAVTAAEMAPSPFPGYWAARGGPTRGSVSVCLAQNGVTQ